LISLQQQPSPGEKLVSGNLSIQKADGVTPSERYLSKLCERSFLSLWSYPGVYRDQGKQDDSREGKEVCDLLVVFENHIIIFSDKYCAFPTTGDVKVNWGRWYNRAVLKSAQQIWGAERWIRQHPDRLFVDRACLRKFPLDVPPSDRAIWHRVVVAHGASDACKFAFGGSGSLMISTRGAESVSHDSPTGLPQPFVVGDVDPHKGFVHVLDDTTLDIVLTQLDTITDFVQYLSKKEELLRSRTHMRAAGEEELLARYLMQLNQAQEHDFNVPSDCNSIVITEGLWQQFLESPQRASMMAANKKSYAWDMLIENFNTHANQGTLHFASHTDVKDHERIYRCLAREPRLRRRVLVDALLGIMAATKCGDRGTRVFAPSWAGDPHYVFLCLPKGASIPDERYREVRRELLYACCMVTKLEFPEAREIVGIGVGSLESREHSEDSLYIDATDWEQDQQEEALELRKRLNLLTNLHRSEATTYEFPINSSIGPHANVLSGNHKPRNKPCPCGSGKKYKRCHGR
jgi:hypothetical protein